MTWLVSDGVYRAEKNTGSDMKVMIEGISQRPMEISVFTNRSELCKFYMSHKAIKLVLGISDVV